MPKVVYGTHWDIPNANKTNQQRIVVIGAAFGTGSKKRCIELLLICFFDPSRIDPALAGLYRTFTHARRMVRKDIDRYGDFVRT